jgi:hypothetical protein
MFKRLSWPEKVTMECRKYPPLRSLSQVESKAKGGIILSGMVAPLFSEGETSEQDSSHHH